MFIPRHLFRPQSLPPNHIPRYRLVELFRQYQQVRLVFVEASAGYGKSVAVNEFVQQLSSPVAWYPLENLDEKSALAFVWNLLRSLQAAQPGFGAQIDSLLQETFSSENPARWLSTIVLPSLINALSTLDSQLWIVLENHHTIHSEEIDSILIQLVETIPPNIHSIVTSRQRPKWLDQLSGVEPAVLGTVSVDELAFTLNESWELAHQIGVPLDLTQIETIYADVGGWPVLHSLLYLHCRDRGTEEIDALMNFLTHPNQLVYNYLAEELLKRQSRAVRDFLCRTAVLRQLDTTTCNALLDIEASAEILDQLREGVFLRTVVGAEKTTFFHSHEIIRDFLLQVLWNEYAPAEARGLYTRLGAWYEARGEREQAIIHYTQGQQWAQISRLIAEQAPVLVGGSDLPRLAVWLSYIPQDQVDQDPTLLIYRGIVLGYQSPPHPLAEEHLRRARSLFEKREDETHVAWVDGELGWVYSRQGNYHRAVDILRTTLERASWPTWLRIKLLHHLAMALVGGGHYAKACKYGEQLTNLLRQSNTRQDHIALTRLLRHLSFAYHRLGQTRGALQLLEEAYQLSQTLQLGDWSLAWIDQLLAETHRRLGSIDTAHAYLDEADKLLDKYNQLLDQYDQGGAHNNLRKMLTITQGNLYRDSYDYVRAEDCYRRAGRGDPNGVMLALRLVQPGYAQEALDLAQEKWRQVQSLTYESPVVIALYQGMLGLAHLNLGHYEQAQLFLEEAEQTLEREKALYALTTTRMYLAKLYFDLDERPRARAYLEQTLQKMQGAGYYNLDWWQPETVAQMCAQAIRHHIEPDFAVQLALERLIPDYASPILPLVSETDLKVRRRAVHILRYWKLRTPLKARELLNACKEGPTKDRLREWLDRSWLTATGLIGLKRHLSWRELEVFLLWINPSIQGSSTEIAAVLDLKVSTINTHLQNAHTKLEGTQILPFQLSGRGAYLQVYHWAIQNHLVNPAADN